MSEYFIKPIVKTLMLKGQEGQSIKEIKKTSTSGLTDTYEISLTDGTKKPFTVSNGKGIVSIAKTSTIGLLDIYTITYNDGTTSTFNVKNGDIADLLDRTYPVGSIYMSVNSTEPSTLFGGTWERLGGRFLIGAGTNTEINSNGEYGDLGRGDPTFAGGETGGQYYHQLTIDEMPKHTHNIKSSSTDGDDKKTWVLKDHMPNTSLERLPWQWGGKAVSYEGSGNKHNNMPPYLAVYMWKRTA
jgi:hypothetical protein